MGFFDDKIVAEPNLTVMGKPVLGDISRLPEYLATNGNFFFFFFF